MDEADKLYRIYDLPHKNRMTPDTVLSFGGRYMILRDYCRMVLVFVAVC